MLLYFFLGTVAFFGAGYYGAVRGHTLHFSFDWVNLRNDDDNRRHMILDWRRKIRLFRLMLVACGSFFFTMAVSLFEEQIQSIDSPYNYLLVILGSMIFWGISQSIWMWIGTQKPRLMELDIFPVRFAEWFITPLYWLIEPFIPSDDADKRGKMQNKEDGDPDGDEEETDGVDEQIIKNALEFKDVRLRDCMIPRTEISGLEIIATIDDLQNAFITSGHSKIVIYDGSLDNVLGYCHALALFKKPKDISSIVIPILTVPEAMPANDLMLRFLEERKNLAVVVDEFGGTAGLVSMEDIIEQIFGEIQDEYDTTEDWVEKEIDEKTYLLSARQEIDYLNEKYNWELPEGDYDTLGGLVISIYEDIPQEGSVIEVEGFVFTIVSVQGNRIELIQVEVAKETQR